MIYVGNFCPSKGSKNSLLQREFFKHGLPQKNVCEGIPATSCQDLLNGVKKQRNKGITYLEDKQTITNLEHDWMAFVGYDRQNSSLTNALIDEFDFLKCSWFYTSILCLNDWRISDDPNGSITTGGLGSLCLNSCQFVDKVYRVGRTLYSFDGLFDFKREKETFYIEVLIRCLTSQNKLLDVFAECQITRILAAIRKTLDDFGRNHKLPRSPMLSMKILHTCTVGRE